MKSEESGVQNYVAAPRHLPSTHPGFVDVEPHEFVPMGRFWHRWLCRHCYAPRKLHPRLKWVKARSLRDHTYLSADAPHFKEGW